jgi:hypothetical protein
MNILDIGIKIRGGKNNQSKRMFYDFIIDGRSLFETLNVDFISGFGWLTIEFQKEYADTILLKRPSELVSGRVPILICPECADLGCGAITVEIRKDKEFISWSNFGFENNYDETIMSLDEYSEFGPFYFKKDAYWSLIHKTVNILE